MKTKTCKHPTCSGPCRRIPTPKKARTRIKTFSTKRQKENKKYSALRKQFLSDNPTCQALLDNCTFQATQVHHMEGRIGTRYLDTGTWLSVCHQCHEQIERQPTLAKTLGLSKSRLAV